MTNDEKDLAKIGAEAAMKPFANLCEKLFGGPVEQVGGMWTDQLKVRRFKRQLALLNEVQRAIDDAGFEPRSLPDNLSIPLLNAATLVDDQSLQQKWAALLANAANPATADNISPTIISILSELTPREAKFLDYMYTVAESGEGGDVFLQERQIGGRLGEEGLSDREFDEDELRDIYVLANLARVRKLSRITFGDLNAHGGEIRKDLHDFRMVIDSLRRHQLILEIVRGARTPVDMSGELRPQIVKKYSLSELGVAFVRACRPPKTE